MTPQEDKRGEDRGKTSGGRHGEPEPDVGARARDRRENNDNKNHPGEGDAVDQAVDRDARQHRADRQPLAVGDEPGTHQRAEPERRQEASEVAGHDRTEQARRADGANGPKELPPFPGADELFGDNRERHHGEEYRVRLKYRRPQLGEAEPSGYPNEAQQRQPCSGERPPVPAARFPGMPAQSLVSMRSRKVR